MNSGPRKSPGQTIKHPSKPHVANNSISTQGAVQEAQIASNTAIAQLTTDASITNTQVLSAANVQAAQINAVTQQVQSTNQANVGIAQTQANVEIAKAIASASNTNSIIGSVGKVAGAALSLL